MICEKCEKKQNNIFIQKQRVLCFECLVPHGGNADSLYTDTYVRYGTNNNTDGSAVKIKGIVVIIEEET